MPLAHYKHTKEKVPLPIVDSIYEILKNVAEKEQVIFPRVEIDLPNNPGQIIDLVMSRHNDDGQEIYTCVMRDYVIHYNHLKEILTEQRTTAMEKELLEIKHEKTTLENELINLKNKELERAKAIKNDFFAKASHELRTPVNGILGLTEILVKTPPESQKEYIDSLAQVANQLKMIVNDLLDLSKLEEKKITFENTPFDIHQVLENIFFSFRPLTDKKNITLQLNVDKQVPRILKGDSTRLTQIIYNLLSNALKFTEKGKIMGSVALTKQVNSQGYYWLWFSIADTGIGIAPDKLVQIFEPYSQESNETYRLYGGTGLGLAVVKQLVEAMQGHISVQSKQNEGTTFSFTLPFEEGESFSSPEKDTNRQNYEGYHVLLADDNPINLVILSKKMQGLGFKVSTVTNGQEALEKLSSKEYHLLCLDVDMPVMNGYETTKQIRATEDTYHQQLPIFLMTAYSYADIEDKVRDIGISDFITKPFEEVLLLEKLNKHLPMLSSYLGKYEVNLNNEQINEFSQGDKVFEKELKQQIIIALDHLKEEYREIISQKKIKEKQIADLVHKYNMVFIMLKEDTLRQEIKNTLMLSDSNKPTYTRSKLQDRIFKLCDEMIAQLRSEDAV
jgi:signal transduction histidine kinase/CheY-like chemotaxis protein